MFRSFTVPFVILFVAASCGGASGPGAAVPPAPSATQPPAATPSPTPALRSTATAGSRLSAADLATLAGFFTDDPFAGGQKAPALSLWANEDTFLWLQLDKDDPKVATTVTAWGLGTKGTYCAESMPDPAGKSFTRFQQHTAASFERGGGGAPGAQGYWLTAISVVRPGIDYAYAPTAAPPACGSAQPPSFAPAGAAKLAGDKLKRFVTFFDSRLLVGGQIAPRLYKSVNEDVSLMIQLNGTDPATVTDLRYIGLSTRGVFCKQAQPSADFPHYHRQTAPTYAEGHGGPPGESAGFWLLWVATRPIVDASGKVTAPTGVDRQFSIMKDIPACP